MWVPRARWRLGRFLLASGRPNGVRVAAGPVHQQYIFSSRKGDRRPTHSLGHGRFFSPLWISSLRVRTSKGALRHVWEMGLWKGVSQQTPVAGLCWHWDGDSRRARALVSETKTPGPSRSSYHGDPRHTGRQAQSLLPQRRWGLSGKHGFTNSHPRSISASGKHRPGQRMPAYASSICLSQRLSHAVLSTSGWYSETENGSLNELWFL